MKTVIRRALSVFLALTFVAVFSACQKNGGHKTTVTPTTAEPTQAPTTEAVTVAEDDKRPHYSTRGIYPGDWSAIVYTGGRDLIYVEDLAPYAETGVTIEVGFSLEERDYYILAICEALGWDKLYKLDSSYISGLVSDKEAFDSRKIPLHYVCMQSDGCVSFTVPGCKNAGIDYDIQAFTFKLEPEAIAYLMERDAKSEGLVLQTYGVNVRYVLLEADEIDTRIK